jgi:hypothetical protein
VDYPGGKLTLQLPATVDDKYLESVRDMFGMSDSITVSPDDAEIFWPEFRVTAGDAYYTPAYGKGDKTEAVPKLKFWNSLDFKRFYLVYLFAQSGYGYRYCKRERWRVYLDRSL